MKMDRSIPWTVIIVTVVTLLLLGFSIACDPINRLVFRLTISSLSNGSGMSGMWGLVSAPPSASADDLMRQHFRIRAAYRILEARKVHIFMGGEFLECTIALVDHNQKRTLYLFRQHSGGWAEREYAP